MEAQVQSCTVPGAPLGASSPSRKQLPQLLGPQNQVSTAPGSDTDAKKWGAFNQVTKPKTPFSLVLHTALSEILKHVMGVRAWASMGTGPNKSLIVPPYQKKKTTTKKTICGSVKLLTPGPLPWATARREAGRPISSPPFWCQGFYSKGKKFKIYTCAKVKAVHPGCQAPSAWGTPVPSPVARELRVLYSSCLQRKAGDQKPSYDVDQDLKRRCWNGRFRNLVSWGDGN